MIPLFLRNSRRALQGAHALRRVSGVRLISVFGHNNYFQVFQGWHKHVACNSFSVSLQTVEELRKAPRFVVGIGNKIFEQSGFFASMVNSFSLVLQNL